MHLSPATSKPSAPDALAAAACSAKAERAQHLSGLIAREKAVATKRAKRGAAHEAAPKVAPRPNDVTCWPNVAVLFDQAGAMARAIVGLKADACRWPMGEGDDFRFCGAPAVIGYRREATTYCAHHADRAFAARSRVAAERVIEEA